MSTIDEPTVRLDADLAPFRRQMNRVQSEIQRSTGDIGGRVAAALREAVRDAAKR